MSADKVAARWGDAGFTHTLADVAWTASIPVLMCLNERSTGDPARNWLTSWAHQWFAGNNLRVLVLGCGEGWLERIVATWPFVDRIDAVDLSPDAVERAKAQAPPNVSYSVADLNRDTLPEAAYDVVVAHMILHHIENLEHAFAQIERTMKRDATLIVNEYAGPNRFQFGDEGVGSFQLRAGNGDFGAVRVRARFSHGFRAGRRPRGGPRVVMSGGLGACATRGVGHRDVRIQMREHSGIVMLVCVAVILGGRSEPDDSSGA